MTELSDGYSVCADRTGISQFHEEHTETVQAVPPLAAAAAGKKGSKSAGKTDVGGRSDGCGIRLHMTDRINTTAFVK